MLAQTEHYKVLARVATVSSICELWGVSKTNVYYHIAMDNLAATQDGKIWLVSVDSAVALWGKPLLQENPGEPNAPDGS
jgi:ligand-binding sensor domain-containing protein